MKSKRPLIAVTGPNKRLAVGWWATRFVLWLVGARSCYITAANPKINTAVDGVIIGGGDDIEPRHYGEQGDAASSYDFARDQLEIAMIKSALNAGIPILGICRGAQLINVVLGGDLLQDIRPLSVLTPNRNSIFGIKYASIKTDSDLYNIVGCDALKINSLHNQAIGRIADSLTAVARDKDHFIQAFESEKDRFLMGVQWHPEYLFYNKIHRHLFTAFVNTVKRQKNTLQSFQLN
jgi:putative glutamine amidotransferase